MLSQFENWLRAHLPAAADSLNPRVDDEDWVQLEEQTGCRLPGGFTTLYRWHDGQARTCPTGIFYGLRFLSMKEVLREWRSNAEEASRETNVEAKASDVVKPGLANARWIPFAADDAGNFLAIDLDPGPAGSHGQVINMGCDELRHYALAPDVLDFVKWMLAELAAGNHRIIDEGGGYSFNTLRPPTQHFLDSAKVIFGNAPARAAPPPRVGPPRDSTIGTFFFIRDELARHAPAGWKSLSVEGKISGKQDSRLVALTHHYQVGDQRLPLQVAAPQALVAAFFELQDRTREERWQWQRMKLDFSADQPDKFQADTD